MSRFSYIWSRYKVQFLLVGIIAVAFALAMLKEFGAVAFVRNAWAAGWDMYPGLATLLVAALVWY